MISIKEYVRAKSNDFLKIAESLDLHRRTNSKPLINKEFGDLIRSSVEFTNSIKLMAIEENCEFGIDNGLADIVKVKVEYIDDITHIMYDNHLPLRTKGYTLNERDIIHRVYLKPMETKIIDSSAKRYHEKAVLCFIHTYTKDNHVVDHDNYEVKPFKDAIAAVFFADDSPYFVADYHDYKIGEQNRTDIYIVPETQFASFLTGGELG